MRGSAHFVIIIDLEATCDTGPQRRVTKLTHEIIEFPFLLYDVQRATVVLAEQHYVLPTTLDDITAFTTQLTGISRATVQQRGEPLAAVVARLEHVFATLVPEASRAHTMLLCDGRWDVHFMLQKELRRAGVALRFPQLWTRYYDLKMEFARACPVDRYPEAAYHPAPSLRHMARFVGSAIVGSHHCGMDDCETILAILQKLFERGHLLREPQMVAPDYDPSLDDEIKDFNEYFERGAISLELVLEALEFDASRVLAVLEAPFVPQRARDSVATYVLVLEDPYCAQVFFSRGNLSALVYSRAHFVSQCQRSQLLPLLCCWRPWLVERDPTLREQGRGALTLPGLLGAAREQSDYFLREVKRFHKSGVWDQCVLKTRLLFFELHAAQVLVEQYERAEIAESQLTDCAALRDADVFAMAWDKLAGPILDECIGNVAADELARLEARVAHARTSANPDSADRAGLAARGVRCAPQHQLPLTRWNTRDDVTASVLAGAFESYYYDEQRRLVAVVGPRPTCASVEDADEDGHPFVIYERVDGIACTLYWFADQWRVATVASCVGDDRVCGEPRFVNPAVNAPSREPDESTETVADAFWRLFRANNYALPKQRDAKHVYLFELCVARGRPQSASLVVREHDALLAHSCVDVAAQPLLLSLERPPPALQWPAVRLLCPGHSATAASALELLRSSPGWQRASPLLGLRGATLASHTQRVALDCVVYEALATSHRFAAAMLRSGFHERLVTESLVTVALAMRESADHSARMVRHFPMLGERWLAVHRCVASALRELEEAWGVARTLGKKDFASFAQSKPNVRAWLLGMRKTQCHDVLLYLRDMVPRRELVSSLLTNSSSSGGGGGGGGGRGRSK